MKKQKVQAKINLEALAGGAFAEKLNEALMQVAENIQNPNTEASWPEILPFPDPRVMRLRYLLFQRPALRASGAHANKARQPVALGKNPRTQPERGPRLPKLCERRAKNHRSGHVRGGATSEKCPRNAANQTGAAPKTKTGSPELLRRVVRR